VHARKGRSRARSIALIGCRCLAGYIERRSVALICESRSDSNGTRHRCGKIETGIARARERERERERERGKERSLVDRHLPLIRGFLARRSDVNSETCNYRDYSPVGRYAFREETNHRNQLLPTLRYLDGINCGVRERNRKRRGVYGRLIVRVHPRVAVRQRGTTVKGEGVGKGKEATGR